MTEQTPEPIEHEPTDEVDGIKHDQNRPSERKLMSLLALAVVVAAVLGGVVGYTVRGSTDAVAEQRAVDTDGAGTAGGAAGDVQPCSSGDPACHPFPRVGYTDRYLGVPLGPVESETAEFTPIGDGPLKVIRVTTEGTVEAERIDGTGFFRLVPTQIVLPDLPEQSAQCRADALEAMRSLMGQQIYAGNQYTTNTGTLLGAEIWTVAPDGRADLLVNAEMIRQGWASAPGKVSSDNAYDPYVWTPRHWRYYAELERTSTKQPCFA